MIELIRRAAARDPDRPAVITDRATTSYGELSAAAASVAAQLDQRGISRLAVLEHDAAAAAALLAGTSLAGAEACMYPPFETAEQVAELAERFDHHVVVSDEPQLTGPFDVIAVADLTSGPERFGGDPPAERPLLILTTGTSGNQRAARHDWNRLLGPSQRTQPTPGQRWLLAYGLQQFAGYQILIHVLAAGATLVAPFPRRPREGLAAMRAHAVDHASATPTFWRFLLAEMRSGGGPVPALRQITMGGEAIPPRLVDQLLEAFPEANVSQIYAATESGSMRSVRDNRHGLPVSLLDHGDEEDLAVKIVDGELWVRSRVGMLGYYGEPPIDPDAWRATGDLVDVEGDRILFRGRASDIINVGGVKVHPLPIEERVAAVDGVAIARVFGRPNPMTGAIVAVEVVAEPGADTEAVDAAIREACDDLLPAARPRSIRFVDSLTTLGDKLVRRTASEG